MTYCQQKVELLKRAGRPIARRLLPKHMTLAFSDHSTGAQMSLWVKTLEGATLCVWKGSAWYSSSYEFNDKDDVPGIQPGFEFARPKIDKFFADLQDAVDRRDKEHEAAALALSEDAENKRASAMEQARKLLLD